LAARRGLVNAAADALLERYQARAQPRRDPLGYYVARWRTRRSGRSASDLRGGSVDDAALAAYAHSATFGTLVGDVTFGDAARGTFSVLTVQFHGSRQRYRAI